MWFEAIRGILLPLIGTSLGAGCVFFLRKKISGGTERLLTGFASGVMAAASFFSLILPAIEQSEHMGRLAFIPAAVGFAAGTACLYAIDKLTPLIQTASQANGDASGLKRTAKLALAVTIHNVPEGVAVGIVYAGYLYGDGSITAAGALALSLGIALQNFPEGAIISMPLHAGGMKKGRSFLYGALSGAVEPVGAAAALLAAGTFLPMLPYLLTFAAGAMFYVVVEELIPGIARDSSPGSGAVWFTVGFVFMMALDVGCG